MDRLVPWAKLVQAIETVYPKNGHRGRPPIGAERMLRLYCIQLWFGLSDERVEDALPIRQFRIAALRRHQSAHRAAPDSTTLLKFRRLLETP
ncbi:MAG: hypothetical protein B7X31_12890 [Thiomonas sp. 13-66-29]|nr:MAG: hypothetical protein B7X46_14585 [Thiomonas sp. 15-66-11]OZB59249.1 MAG: hypothetical protein B7X31_12890 [Thiomonas sp. 13-66-29]